MKVIAGFWVSSRTRLPQPGKHTDNDFVVCKSELESSILTMRRYDQLPFGWYWLDTNYRRELTIEESYAATRLASLGKRSREARVKRESIEPLDTESSAKGD